MSAKLTIDPALSDAIATTVVLRRRLEVLRAGIERAIADPEYFSVYMRQLDLVLTRPLPSKLRELLPVERENAVRTYGVCVLSDDEIEHMSLSPYQLSQVQRAVLDEPEMITDHWIDAIDAAMAQSLKERPATGRNINEIVDSAFAEAGIERPS